ncbi:MAG TPA: hypothetical protein DEA08_06885 [Planctomycetes bacterium]|nr:hypothetical protein [Planctomycetota bacterium]
MTDEALVWDCTACSTKGVPDAESCAKCGASQPQDVLLYPPEGSQQEQFLLGLWDCPSCDGVGLRGDQNNCSSCGAARPEEVKFYLPEDAEEITDQAGVAAAKAGPDWQCEYCDQWVAATLERCPYCDGGELEGAKRQEVKEEVTLAGQPQLTPDTVVEVSEVSDEAEASPASGMACLVIGLLLAALCCFFMWPSKVGVTVSGHSWERVQEVEVNRIVAKEGWNKPGDAFDVTSERKVHHHDKVLVRTETRTKTVTEKVKVGTEKYKAGTKKVDLGNGRFKKVPVYKKRPVYETRKKQVPYEHKVFKEVPRYQTWYRYKVRRWVAGTPRKASGEGLEARWPEATLADPKQERLGQRSATYTVHISSEQEGKSYSFSCPEDEWRRYTKGSRWTATVQAGRVTGLRAPE